MVDPLPKQMSLTATSTNQNAQQLPKATQQPQQKASSPALEDFHLFPRLPFDMRAQIWRLTLPSRVIEVYNKPDCYDNNAHISSFSWHAVKCKCSGKCYKEPTIARVNHEAREVVRTSRSRCFGQWIYWDRDIIYIGERVGTLHNTGFLHALEVSGCRHKLRYLAVDYGCWGHSQIYPCPTGNQEACTPAAMTSRLPGLQSLTIVQKHSKGQNKRRDNHPFCTYGPYRYNPGPHFGERGYGNWFYETGNYPASRLKAEPSDPWICHGDSRLIHGPHNDGSGSYFYRGPESGTTGPYIIRETDEQLCGEDGGCGIALVIFERIKLVYTNQKPRKRETPLVVECLRKEFEKLKLPRSHHYPGDPDYKTWKHPSIGYVSLRPK